MWFSSIRSVIAAPFGTMPGRPTFDRVVEAQLPLRDELQHTVATKVLVTLPIALLP